MTFKYIFFDLDGTLTDPAEGITNSFIFALNYFNIEIPSYKTLCSFIGPTLISTFQDFFHFSASQTEEAIKKYREYFATKGLFENSVYKGIPELLQFLTEKGFSLFVTTSKPQEYAQRILEHYDLSKYFIHIFGANMNEKHGEKGGIIQQAINSSKIANKSEILMIGDRKYDIQGAKQNNIYSCAVLYGYGSYQELSKENPDFLVSSVEEIKNITK